MNPNPSSGVLPEYGLQPFFQHTELLGVGCEFQSDIECRGCLYDTFRMAECFETVSPVILSDAAIADAAEWQVGIDDMRNGVVDTYAAR